MGCKDHMAILAGVYLPVEVTLRWHVEGKGLLLLLVLFQMENSFYFHNIDRRSDDFEVTPSMILERYGNSLYFAFKRRHLSE